MKFKAACIQINTKNNREHNTRRAVQLIRDAVREGAQLVCTPENTFFMGNNSAELKANVFPADADPSVATLQRLARDLQIDIIIGSVAVKKKRAHKLSNRSYYINSQGDIICHYDKIHLYDVRLSATESYKESRDFTAGSKVKFVDSQYGRLGMTICYDVRFPELYRKLVKEDCLMLNIPSSFMYTTGQDHWHVLMRARAIENNCFVFAAAQCGVHNTIRKSYGHSLIIDPWGNILAEADAADEGFIIAEIDLDYARQCRERINSLPRI
jgi:predicted amidohydrolase